MLATDELIQEASLAHRLAETLPRWLREVPLYQRGVSLPDEAGAALSIEQLRRLPFITKQDIRRDFPRNFLRAGVELDALLDQELIELEHTSGTSEERTAVLFGRGWWNEQEARVLALKDGVRRQAARQAGVCRAKFV